MCWPTLLYDLLDDILMYPRADQQQKSYNLRHPRIVASSTEHEIMAALQNVWTDNVGVANAANIAAHALLHAIMAVNGNDESAVGFLSSALQMAGRLAPSKDPRPGKQDLHCPEAWAIWSAYCGAVFDDHQIVETRTPPTIAMPEPSRDRDHKAWTPPSHNGPWRASLSPSILWARCSLAKVAAGIAARRDDRVRGPDGVAAVLDLRQQLIEWHEDLPFALHNLHNATSQHLLLL